MNLNEMLNIHHCDICDNAVQFDTCVECGEYVCVICHNEYGCLFY